MWVLVTTVTLICGLVSGVAQAGPEARLKLSLRDAMEVGLVRSYTMRLARADRETTDAQVWEAFAEFWPRVDASASYERVFVTPNPFAGSDAASLFAGGNTSGWVAFNERVARDPNSLNVDAIRATCAAAGVTYGTSAQELSYGEYQACLSAGQAQAGYVPPGAEDNPFLVENNIRAGLAVSMLIYDGAAFAGIDAAQIAGESAEAQLESSVRQVAADIARAYYGLLLAQASVEVVQKSVERSRQTVDEAVARVRQGVVPQFQQLSAEVELANLDTQLVTARAQADAARESLAMVLGLPVSSQLIPTDELALPDGVVPPTQSSEASWEQALEQRPDVKAARKNVELQKKLEDVTFARYLPQLKLVFNVGIVGNVPDDTSSYASVIDDPELYLASNPFAYQRTDRGIFDEAYWGTSVTGGLNLTWNLFEGFRTAATLEQNKLDTKRAKIRLEQLEQSVSQEISSQRRNMTSALERVRSQARNVDRAELNYRHAELRVKEGVSTQLELRDASQQLDQSRFNRLQAVHDYLVAKIGYEIAIGEPPFEATEESDHD